MAYLDRVACAPVLTEVIQRMNELMAVNGMNPLSPTRSGSNMKNALEKAREQVASLIGADSKEVIMVSNGTESVNLALRGIAHSAARSRNQRRIIVSAIEHVSVMSTVRALEKEGFETVVVPVDSHGTIDITRFDEALDHTALLASVQMANPEIGTIQDIQILAEHAHDRGVLFHTDAIDAVGWVPVNVNELKVDALSFSGTQYGGPPGAAALFLRKGVSLMPLFTGGFQERHRRSGLENIPAIAGFGLASQIAERTLPDRIVRARLLGDRLRKGLSTIHSVILTGHPEQRIPGHVSVLIRYVEGEALLLMLDMKGIQAASGSSCTAKDLKISPVLIALGFDHADAQGSLVFSTSMETTEADIDTIMVELPRIVQRLRDMSPLWSQHKQCSG